MATLGFELLNLVEMKKPMAVAGERSALASDVAFLKSDLLA